MTIREIRESLENDNFVWKNENFLRMFIKKQFTTDEFVTELRQNHGRGPKTVKYVALLSLMSSNRSGNDSPARTHHGMPVKLGLSHNFLASHCSPQAVTQSWENVSVLRGFVFASQGH